MRSKVQSDPRPFGRAGQNHDGDFSSGKVLLISDPSIGRDQYINSCLFSCVEQCAVVELVPSSGLGCDDRVAGKPRGKALWRSVVKENEHRPGRRVAPVLKP
jgi:hypothetical protein